MGLNDTPIEKDFAAIVSTEDTMVGKPDQEISRLALQRMDAAEPFPSPPVRTEERPVFENSRAGIRSAHAAGMKIVALKTTSSADQRLDADWILGSFRGMSLARLEWLVG